MHSNASTHHRTAPFALRVMLLLLAAATASAVLTAAVPAGQAQAATVTTVSITGKAHQADARAIRAKINALRSGSSAWYWNSSNTKKVRVSGLSSLTYDYGLEKAAIQRAVEIAVSYGHDRPDGSRCFTAWSSKGYVGENIAMGQTSAAQAHTSWAEANEYYSGQGHRRTMLNSHFKYVGIACVEVNGVRCWVEEFSSNAVSTKSTTALSGSISRSVKVRGASFGVALSSSKALTIELGCSSTSAALPKAVPYVKTSGTWSGIGYVPYGSASWSSSKASVARISGSKAVGVSAGTAVLTAKCSSTGAKATVTVTVRAHTHSWGAWRTTSASTCTRAGTRVRTCTKNSSHTETSTLALAAHTAVTDRAVAATCTSAGRTAGSHCSVCGKVITAQQAVPALGHSWSSTSYSWLSSGTCTAARSCTRQGCTARQTESAAWSSRVTKAATCTASGTTTYCAYFPTLPSATKAVAGTPAALGHSYQVTSVTKPTCTAQGYTSYRCSRCSAAKTGDYTAALGHSYQVSSVTKPTCTAQGYTAYRCSRCSASKTGDYTSALGHDMRLASTAAATCTSAKRVTYACSRCSRTSSETVGEALGHSMRTLAAVAPTCTKAGLTEGEGCSRCSYVSRAQKKVAALGHVAVDVPAQEPTATRAGRTAGTSCAVCGAVLSGQEAVPATGSAKASSASAKKAQHPRIAKTAARVSASRLRGGSRIVLALRAAGAHGSVSFRKVGGPARVTVSASGKVRVRKGTPRGTYRVRVRVCAAGTASYAAGSSTATVTVRVR